MEESVFSPIRWSSCNLPIKRCRVQTWGWPWHTAFTAIPRSVKTPHHELHHRCGIRPSTTHGTSQQCPIATSPTCICSHILLLSRLTDNMLLLLHLSWLFASLPSPVWETSTPWMKVMEITERPSTGYELGLWLRTQIMRKILFTETEPWPMSHSIVFKSLAVFSHCWSSLKAPAYFPVPTILT